MWANGRRIQPKLDRPDPVKPAASELAVQYQSDTDSDLPWTMRKYVPISKQKCKTLNKWCGACNSAVSGWHWLLSGVNQSHMQPAPFIRHQAIAGSSNHWARDASVASALLVDAVPGTKQ